MNNIIVKHRCGLVTDCHHLPMVPIVSQSAPMVSVADVSVKLYPEHTNMCYHTRTRATFSHVFYMAIYIVERTEFLMEFMLFHYHKLRKEIFICLTFPISNVI